MVELAPLPYSCERFVCYSDRLHDISITIPALLDITKMLISIVSFFAQLDYGIHCPYNAFLRPMI